MNDIYIFDFEVTKYDWLVVVKKLDSDEWGIMHNTPDVVRNFIEMHDPILCGFNVKNYDQWILKAVLEDYTPEEVKDVNDWVIGGNSGWEYSPLRDCRYRLNLIDLMDDCQTGLSLKAIEAHLGMDIEETTVDFDIDRPWTKEELDRMIFYCKADVSATEKLYHLRENYLEGKKKVGRMKGIPDERSLYMTNARLTAEFLRARKREYGDERKYVIPNNLKREYIPQEVFDFFGKMYDPNLTDDEVFKDKLKIFIGETEVTIGYGGIHAGIPNYQYDKNAL